MTREENPDRPLTTCYGCGCWMIAKSNKRFCCNRCKTRYHLQESKRRKRERDDEDDEKDGD